MMARRELYSSSNGDRWFLVRDSESGIPYVVHEPNPASGGNMVHIEIAAFLAQHSNAPEKEALLRLIGTLAEGA
jgi:hypothetical protein